MKTHYNRVVIRRWNLTILIILLAFVVGIGIGYTYRDRFSSLLPNTTELDRTQPDISQELFRTEVSEMLKPETGLEATSGQAEVYNFTGRVAALSGNQLTLEVPSDATPTEDAIDFTLTEGTIYVSLDVLTDENGLPAAVEDEISRADLSIGDMVNVQTSEDIKTATERHVLKLQQLVN